MSDEDLKRLADGVARRARDRGVTVAAAESLTSGLLLSALGRGEQAADWLRGGVVAYSTEVKHTVLGVTPGPVVTARCADEMAEGVARLLQAGVAVSTTGVGGPDAEEGEPPGTVHLGWWRDGRSGTEAHRFEGSPSDVVEQTVLAALRLLQSVLDDA